VLIIRHAAAESSEETGVADEQRQLTPKGEKKFASGARGLARIMTPPDVILTSPLPRARRTAEMTATIFGGIPLVEADALAGGSLGDVIAQLALQPAEATVAVVGHEPQLGALLARFVGSDDAARFSFKKGGVALCELDDVQSAVGRLVFYLPPRVLRTLGD
jgi:phosphohistidine phosphatase